MAICNLNNSDQIKYNLNKSILGDKEAFRDYIEQNGLIRPASVINKKLNDEIVSYPEQPNLFLEYLQMPSAQDVLTDKKLKNSIQSIIRISNASNSLLAMEKFSQRLGIGYKIISVNEAFDITGKTDVKGFYKSGFVYFVDGMFTSDTVFHEFAHPIINALAKDNPELFAKLYSDVESEFIEEVANKTTGYYEKDTEEFRKEVLVQALTKVNGTETPKTWLGRLLYNIKQFLRGKFGKKINLKGLSNKTTLKEFVDMINYGKEFELDMDFLTEEDFIYFENDYKKYHDKLNNTEEINIKVQRLANEFSSMVNNQIQALSTMKGFMSLQEGLIDTETNDLLLQRMKRSLDLIAGKEKFNSVEDIKGGLLSPINLAAKVNTYIEQVVRIEGLVEILGQKIDFLKNEDLQVYENLDALHAALQLLNQYKSFLIKANTVPGVYVTFENNSNPLRDRVTKIIDDITEIQIPAHEMSANVVIDMVYSHLSNITERGKEFYENQLNSLKTDSSEYSKVHKEYTGLYPEELVEFENLKLQKEKGTLNSIEKKRYNELLEEKFDSENLTKEEFREYVLNDKNQSSKLSQFFNRMFESFSLNQDKAIGGFYSFLMNEVNEMKANINARQNDLLGNNQLYDLLDKAGWGNKRHYKSHILGREIGHIVDIGMLNKDTNEIESFEEWQYLSTFKNHEAYSASLKHEITIAYDNYKTTNSTADRVILAELQEKDFFHKMYFMNQDKIDQYYIIESIKYATPAGRKARWAEEDIHNKINFLGTAIDARADIEIAKARAELFNELAQLANNYNLDGSKKTGEALEIAQILSQYHLERNKAEMFEWKADELSFSNSYNAAVQEIKDRIGGSKGFDANNETQNDKLIEELDKWLEYNTTTMVETAYYDRRKQLIEQRDAILAPLKQINQLEFDLAPLYEELYELNRQSRDSSGQYDGIIAEEDKLKRIKELHQKIEEETLKMYYISGKGLTKQEAIDYWQLYELYKEDQLSPDQQAYFEALVYQRQQSFSEFGILKEDLDRLDEINNELKFLTKTHFTSHYVSQWNNLIEENEDVKNGILDILVYSIPGSEIDDYETLTEDTIKELLKSTNRVKLEALLEIPEFGTWFELNHYSASATEEVQTQKWKTVNVYKPTSVWYKTSPKDTDYYQSFELYDDNGNSLGILKDSNGIPRVPNANYQNRSLKDDFKTNADNNRDYIDIDKDGNEQLVIATKNTRNQWLPKSIAQRKELAVMLMGREIGLFDPTEEEIVEYMTTNDKFNMDGAAWDRYINYDYQAMFDNNRNLFNLLDYLKNWKLDNEEDLNPSQRTGLTYPKLRMDGIEDLTSKGWWKRRVTRFVDAFGVREDDAENDLYNLRTAEDNEKLESLDRPISGAYRGIDINEVSTDIIETSSRQMYSINEYLTYRKLNSFAKIYQFALTKNFQDEQFYALGQKAHAVNTFSSNKEETVRAKAINSLIDKHFRGSQLADLSNNPIGQKSQKLVGTVLNKAMQWSSRKWFMFNPMSGLTNFASGNLQAIYKFAYADQFMNPLDFVIGHRKSTRTLNEYARKSFSAKGKSAQMQLMDVLDASPDKYLKQISDPGTRSILKDLYEGKVGYASRAWMTHEINYMAMYGLMNNKKNKFKVNGKKVSLDEVIELDSKGRLTTKVGVPTEWSITYNENNKVVLGESVKKLMNLHKGYLIKIHGMGGKYNDGDYDRYLLGKMVGFIFKFLPGMLTDRYATRIRTDFKNKNISQKVRLKRRFNYNTEQYEMGTVVSALGLAWNAITFNKSALTNMPKLKEQFQGMVVLTMTYLMSWIFSFLRYALPFYGSGDDDKKNPTWMGSHFGNTYTSLKNVTSLPELPFVSPDRTFTTVNYTNWWKLQANRLMLRVQRENESFQVGNTLSIITNQFTDPAALGGTIKDVKDLASTFYATFSTPSSDRFEEYLEENDLIESYNKKNPAEVGQSSGPYIWQQKGGNKFVKHLANMYGFNGNMIDPYTAIKNESTYFKEGTNPLNVLLGDPKYQPERPYKVTKY